MRPSIALGAPIAGLKRLPVAVSGSWLVEAEPRWKGQVSAADRLVALLFLGIGREVVWSKSERPGPEPGEIDLAFFGMQEEGGSTQLNVSFQGGGHRYATVLAEAPRSIEIPAESSAWTGQSWCLARVNGPRPIGVHVLFIAASDVEVGRNGLWRVRKYLEGKVPGPWAAILTRGRTGDAEAA
jgi:hypothetical protein